MRSHRSFPAALLAVLVGLAVGVGAGAAQGLEVPSGIIGVPTGDDDAPCGGAAVLISRDGLALTLDEALPDAHLGNHGEHIKRAESIPVVLSGGRHRMAQVVTRGTTTTAVLLRINNLPSTGCEPVMLADSALLGVGDRVWTAGNSFGSLELDGVAAISRGSLSGIYALPANSPPVHGRGGRILSDYRGSVFETDAAVNDGNQGGALLDDAGRLIGLVSLGTARERRLGTAVPIDLVLKDLGLASSHIRPARQADDALARAAVALAPGVALVYFERSKGTGNPPEAMLPRPEHLLTEVPSYQREQLQAAWDAYYHTQQMLYTDQEVSALVVDAKAGLMLTAASNLHGDPERGVVVIPGAPAIPCTVRATYLPLDLALLKAEQPLPLPEMTFAASPQLVVGAPVGVLARHRRDAGHTLTCGVVSATARRFSADEISFAQTDARANYGSLGGAVLDASGAVVGMVVMMGPSERMPWAINSGVTLFVDSTTLLRVLPGLRHGDSVHAAAVLTIGQFAGQPNDIHPVLRHPTAAATAAGAHSEDVVISIAGVEIDSRAAIIRALLRHRAGDTVPVVVRREAATLTLQVPLTAVVPEGQ